MMDHEAAATTGMKRPRSSSADKTEEVQHKKRRVQHALRYVQPRPQYIEPAPQDPVFVQAQLLKSIGAALVVAGFDSVKPTALEMFRSHVEEYMLRFLSHTRTSMQANRRMQPTAQDFASALSQTPSSYTASLLEPHLRLPIPIDISCPTIPEPAPLPLTAPDFTSLLEPLILRGPPQWIPKHFPSLPPLHAWKQTPVYPEREKDARQMREKASEEGILAEQALRKLAAAAKTSAINAEKRRSSMLRGEGKSRAGRKSEASRAKMYGAIYSEILQELGGGSEDSAMAFDTTAEAKEGMDLGMPEGLIVNHDMSHWLN